MHEIDIWAHQTNLQSKSDLVTDQPQPEVRWQVMFYSPEYLEEEQKSC